jgi:hypothetical protein
LTLIYDCGLIRQLCPGMNLCNDGCFEAVA